MGNYEFTWLRKDLILSLFGSDPCEALDLFNQYACSDDAEAKIELEEIRNSMGLGAYGNDLFVEEFQNMLNSGSTDFELGKKQGLQENVLDAENKKTISFEMLVNAHNKVTGISFEEMGSSDRGEQLVDARAVFVWLVLKLKLGVTKDLANLLHRDTTSIMRLKQRVGLSSKLREHADEIMSKLYLEQSLEPPFVENVL